MKNDNKRAHTDESSEIYRSTRSKTLAEGRSESSGSTQISSRGEQPEASQPIEVYIYGDESLTSCNERSKKDKSFYEFKHGINSFHIACLVGDWEHAETIYKYWEDPQDNDSIETILSTDENERNALHLACIHSKTDIAATLITKYPYLTSKPDKFGNFALQYARNIISELYSLLPKNNLIIACINNDWDSVKAFIDENPTKIFSTDAYGQNFFHACCMSQNFNLLENIINALPDDILFLSPIWVEIKQSNDTPTSLQRYNIPKVGKLEILQEISGNNDYIGNIPLDYVESQTLRSEISNLIKVGKGTLNLEPYYKGRVIKLSRALDTIETITSQEKGNDRNPNSVSSENLDLANMLNTCGNRLLRLSKSHSYELPLNHEADTVKARILVYEKATKSMIEKIGLNQSSKQLAEFASRIPS